MPEHTHDFIEIVYVRSGAATETVNDATYKIGRGDFTFINYGATHEFTPHGEFSYTNICFAPEMLGDAITPENAFALLQLTAFDELRREEESGVVSFAAAEREEIEMLLDAMQNECHRKRQSWQTVLKSYMNILLVRILRRMTAGQEEAVETADVWQALSDYIDRNLGGELSLSALAGKCFYNPSYFSRAFKEKFGVSFVEYVGRRRVEHAIALLRESEMSIDEISEAVGFADRRNLYHAFSKYAGATPAEFRLATRGKKTPQTGKSCKKNG